MTAVSTKRAVRKFDPRPLEAEDLQRILHAGRHAGSSKNLQRWDFVVCRERDHLRELAVHVKRDRPDIRVLFMSGYAPPLSTSEGRLEPGMPLLEKPFTAHTRDQPYS